MMSPSIWAIDNMDLFMTPELAPIEWLSWIGDWFDIRILPELPEERQRAIIGQLGWLFSRRGTKAGLERTLELFCGVRPEIIEPAEEPCHFIVRLPMSDSRVKLSRETIETLIVAHKPAYATFALELI